MTDATRLAAACPTVKFLCEKGAKVILASHLGRPKKKVVEGLRMNPIAAKLSELLGKDVSIVWLLELMVLVGMEGFSRSVIAADVCVISFVANSRTMPCLSSLKCMMGNEQALGDCLGPHDSICSENATAFGAF